ncbi:SdpI family protein [Arthrobacter russicus]|uniref:SdpI/YhfL protein family protein n=1 Tax=Arthrobacter russicus TaxID=172040 RepID=A0ABU1JEZ6_9MICC|nr:SdpI family protein [Arthrobacter russicus]MDN5669058.1 SdpI family protein [Renibacterium salmoninarum]MDR6271008.1 hypothetical protein [Arthrobacter russicus]
MEIVILGWVFTGLLLLLCLASFAAGRGMIPPNHFFGIRIPPLRRSAAAWRAGHAAAVLPALVAFVLSLLCSILGTITPAASIGSITVFIAGLLWTVLSAIRAADAA